MRLIKIAFVTGILFSIVGCDPQQTSNKQPSADPTVIASSAISSHAEDIQVSPCGEMITERNMIKNGQFFEAMIALGYCAEKSAGPIAKELYADAEIRWRKQVIENTLASNKDRLTAIEALNEKYPEQGGIYLADIKKLKQEVEIEAKAEAKAAQLAAKEAQLAARKAEREKRRQGVSLGMSTTDVVASSWGRPQSINRTVGSFGVHEQWVYGERNYLYFENGILTTIQN